MYFGNHSKIAAKYDIVLQFKYRADDMIIVRKLISGAPAPQPGSKQASLEKLLVDIFSRKLTGQLIERAEYRQIYEDAFGKYAIND